ncbi:MAG: hypothetical protein Q4C96_11230 [Planctomycetia bacterium]|nr:hypothetical protein [Planctomycetia bacterium]
MEKHFSLSRNGETRSGRAQQEKTSRRRTFRKWKIFLFFSGTARRDEEQISARQGNVW